MSYRQQLDHVLSNPTDELSSQIRPAVSGRQMHGFHGTGGESDGRSSSRAKKQSPGRHDRAGSESHGEDSQRGKSSSSVTRSAYKTDVLDGARVREQTDGAQSSAQFNRLKVLQTREMSGNGLREVETADKLLEAALEAEARGDFAGATGLYERSAGQGSAEAAAALGFILEHGRGIPRDDVEAVHW